MRLLGSSPFLFKAFTLSRVVYEDFLNLRCHYLEVEVCRSPVLSGGPSHL